MARRYLLVLLPAFAAGLLFIPPTLEAVAQEAPDISDAGPAELLAMAGAGSAPTSATALATITPVAPQDDPASIAGAVWDLFARYRWKAVLMVAVMLMVSLVAFGGGWLGDNGFPRVAAFCERDSVRFGSVFLFAFLASVFRALAAGDGWTRDTFTDGVVLGWGAIATNQGWKIFQRSRAAKKAAAAPDPAPPPQGTP